MNVSEPPRSRRAVVVGGVRTPFVKAFAEFTKLDTIALGAAATRALLSRFPISPKEIDSIVWGGVILPPTAANVGREIALDLRLPASVEGMTCTRACASGLQAITLAVSAIERGDADVVIAGGSDSTSNASVTLPSKLTHAVAPIAFGKAGARDYLAAAAQLWPLGEILPRRPEIAERTTGEVMGAAAERMARTWGISREAQDRFAAQSHRRAAASIASGRIAAEVEPLDVPDSDRVERDTIVRGDTTVERLAKLKPVFAADGTVTAGNASPLTDGAAAVLLMAEDKARALGLTPLAAFRSWAYVGVDPADQLLIGPALAMPKALGRAGMNLADVDVFDLHEAFAAQVLCVLAALDSRRFAKEWLGREEPVGELTPDQINLHGGSLALGHPFGATGARIVTTVANELSQSGKGTALIGICAAGGLGAAALLESV